MDTIPNTLFALTVPLCILCLIAGLLTLAWMAYKNGQILHFCNGEMETMPWNAAVKAFNSGKPTPALFFSAQSSALAMIQNSVLPQIFNAEQLAEMQSTTALSKMNDKIATDPLAAAVYKRVTELCQKARCELSPFGPSIASVRDRLQQQIDAVIIEETRSLAAIICEAEVDEFRNMSADDPRYREETDRWLNGD